MSYHLIRHSQRHDTCLYKVPQLTVHIRAKPSHDFEGIVVELQDRIVERHISGEGYQKMSAALKVPKNTVASIILKWKKFGTTKTVPRAGHPAKLNNRRRRAWVREGTKNPMVTQTELQSSFVEMGKTFQKDNHLCSTSPIRPLW